MADIKTVLPELPKPWGYARNVDGRIQISVGPDRPPCNERGGGYFTPWAAMYGGDMMVDYAEAAVLSANAGKVDAVPISSGYALENFAVWIAQELHPMSESRETVERLLHAYINDSAPTQQAIDAGKV